MTSRHRRDFLLGNGGISALALNDELLYAYLQLVAHDFEGALIVPIPVLTEVRSRARSIDVKTDRLLKAIGGTTDVFMPLDTATAMRAGSCAPRRWAPASGMTLHDRRPDCRDGRAAQPARQP